MKTHFVYILKCSDNSYYIGHTNNIEQRVAEHQNGQGGYYTSSRLPVELVFLQDCATQDEAFIFERKIKGWSRNKKEALINNDWNKIKKLAKKDFNKFNNPSIRSSAATQDV